MKSERTFRGFWSVGNVMFLSHPDTVHFTIIHQSVHLCFMAFPTCCYVIFHNFFKLKENINFTGIDHSRQLPNPSSFRVWL